MIKKSIFLFLFFVLSTISTGCWDRVEVDKLAIIVGLGIDKIPGSNPYLLTAQVVNPSALKKDGGGQEKPFIVATAQGKTIYDAVRNFSKDSPRRFFFSHNSIIVIGDNMARSGVQPILDFFERDPQFRRTAWMLVTPKSANEILESSLDLEKLSAKGVEGMIREFHQSAAVKVVQRKEFMGALASKSRSTVASRLNLVDEAATAKRKLKEAGGEEDNSSGKEEKQLRLDGTALFHKDKLVGYMNDAETRGLLWILGDVRGGAVVAPCPDQEEGNVVFGIKTTKSQFTPSFDREKLKLHIEIEEEGTISEVSCAKLDISKPETIKELEKLKSKDIEDRIMQTISKAQELKSDIFGFGDEFYRKDPIKWKKVEKDWGQHFSEMEVTIHVICKIRRVGMTSKPVIIEE